MRPLPGVKTMEANFEPGDRTVTIALTEPAKLQTCVTSRRTRIVESLQHDLKDR